MEKPSEIDAKEAAEIAAYYLKVMIPAAENLLLEEVEKSDEAENPKWLITLSFTLDPSLSGGIMGFQRAMGRRDYKILTVDSMTKEVISMKIRSV